MPRGCACSARSENCALLNRRCDRSDRAAIDQGREPPGILRNSNRGRIDFTTGIFQHPDKMADIARRSGD
jgi:hypothetical protein